MAQIITDLAGHSLKEIISSHDRLRTTIPVGTGGGEADLPLAEIVLANVQPGEVWQVLHGSNATNDRASGGDIGYTNYLYVSCETSPGVWKEIRVGAVANGIGAQGGGWDVTATADHHTQRNLQTWIEYAPNGITEALFPWWGTARAALKFEHRGRAYNGSDGSGVLTIDQAHVQVARYVDAGYVPPPPPPQGAPVVFAFTDTAQSATDASQYTFTQSIGAPDANRDVVVLVGGRQNTSGRAISAVTIAGIAATRDASISNASSGSDVIEVWRARVPQGTSATVIITWTGTMLRCVVQTGTMIGSSLALIGTGKSTSASALAMTTTLEARAGGAVLAMATGGQFVNTWTGATKALQTGNVEGGYYVSTASAATTEFNAAYQVRVTTDSAWYAPALVAVSYANLS